MSLQQPSQLKTTSGDGLQEAYPSSVERTISQSHRRTFGLKEYVLSLSTAYAIIKDADKTPLAV